MEKITEEMQVHLSWYEEAKKQTPDTIEAFIKKLTAKYDHDYGTICHAVAAAAIAAAWAVDNSPSGGITGFQFGAIMWEFVRHWNYSSNKTGLRILDYDKLLYPQYSDTFQNFIDPKVFEALQHEAATLIQKADASRVKYTHDLGKYETEISAYAEKFPEYRRDPKKFERLGIGNAEQWAAEKKKEESGFEFAPNKPYLGVGPGDAVYEHWKTIVAGVPPFGYKIKAKK